MDESAIYNCTAAGKLHEAKPRAIGSVVSAIKLHLLVRTVLVCN